MKKKGLLFIFILITASTLFANVWRVNNNPGIDADFSTFREAHDAVADGDTLLFEGSVTPYGSLDTLSKKLVIIGPGYFLNQNDTTNDNPNTATLVQLYIDSLAAGSSIISMKFYGFNAGVDIDADSILFARNYVDGGVMIADNNKVRNIVIRKNYTTGGVGTRWSGNEKTVTNAIIANNYSKRNIVLNESSTAMVYNNVCFQTISTFAATVKNNISNAIQDPGNSVHEYNIVFQNAPAGVGNQGNVDEETVFMSYDDNGTFSTDGRLQLASGSPAVGAGENGTDCGMFGGNDPYILSGYPPVPAILNIEMPVTATGSMKVKIKARYQK